jgi:hypothetical protein
VKERSTKKERKKRREKRRTREVDKRKGLSL